MTRKAGRGKTFTQNEAEELDDEIEDIAEDELVDSPLTNATEVLLFSGTGMQGKHAIAKLRLIKLDNPGAGYKGEIPLNSTLETIGQTFGDGNYQIEALNASHKVLRTLSNQRIALNAPQPEKQSNVSYLPGLQASELDRVQNLAMQTANESRVQSQQFLTLVTTMLNSTAERERAHAAETRRETQAFMTGMLAAQQATFAQMMTLLQTGHNQTLEQLRALPRNTTDNSERMMQMLVQGITLGRDLDEPEEQPFWRELLEGGTHLLSSVAASRNPDKQSTALAKTTEPAVKPSKSLKLTPQRKKELKNMLELSQALRAQGIDPVAFTDMLKNGEFPAMGEHPAPDDDEQDDIDEETDDDDDSTESSGEPGEFDDTGDDDSEPDSE